MGDYDQSMAKWGGDDFSANSLSFAQNDKVSKEGVDRLVADIKKQ